MNKTGDAFSMHTKKILESKGCILMLSHTYHYALDRIHYRLHGQHVKNICIEITVNKA